MRLKWLLLLTPVLLNAQPDPASAAYKAWSQEHSTLD